MNIDITAALKKLDAQKTSNRIDDTPEEDSFIVKESKAIAGENAHQLNMQGRRLLSEGKIGEALKLSLESIGEQFKYMTGNSKAPSSGLSASATQTSKENSRE